MAETSPSPNGTGTAAHGADTDVAVIGAGPVGLFAVFELGMLGLKATVVDALDMIGGQCVALYPEKPIYDIPGYPRVGAAELIERLAEQAAPFAPAYRLGNQVVGLTRTEDERWRLTLSDGAEIVATVVVVAAGVGAFGPNRPPLPGIEKFEHLPPGHGVHYLVGRKEDYRGKRVVIAGGGDSALDWAIELADVAASVAVVHRRDKFRGAPESVSRLRQLAEAGAIDIVVPYQLAGVEGDDKGLAAVTVRTLEGEERRLDADALLPFFGLSMNLGPIADWGLALTKNHIAVDQATCATSAPGIFAIGDIATYDHKLKLILTGFAEAASAAHAIFPLVRPGEMLHFEYSTTKGVPGAAA
ncbi:MAG: NAD(P)/FAD-dependent oxidoreductase [Azospirillaceae bacterium]